MDWLRVLFTDHESVATSVLILALAAAGGLAIGSVKVRSVSLGVAGVLFSGLILGHFGLTINKEVLHFAREFGLILFVYAVGIQVGPGFFAALRSEGLRLNLCAAGVVVGGALLTVLISSTANIAMPIAVGMFSGATTNTPSLAAAGQALIENPPSLALAYEALGQVNPSKLSGLPALSAMTPAEQASLISEASKMPGLGYAVAYPFGVIGIIITMFIVRVIFRVDPVKEDEAYIALQSKKTAQLTTKHLRVTNPNLFGKRIDEIPAYERLSVVVSRIKQGDQVSVARPETVVREGDVLLVVGSPASTDQFQQIVGEQSDVDLRTEDVGIVARRLVVTRKDILGKSVAELDFVRDYGVQITRVRKGDVELIPNEDVRIEFADRVLAVGTPEAIEKAAKRIGDSPSQLDHADVIVIFIGVALGVIVGSIPFTLPGMPAAVKLGLAGGPLLVAILLSRVGRIGPVVSYLPRSGAFMLREVGIVLFLACVGIKSGDTFVATLTLGEGLKWMAYAALITVVPLLVVGAIARVFLKVNYSVLLGVLSGSMTDPPALAFANAMTKSQGASIAYATVYPLTMILRVLCAQLMVLLFVH
jgi:putative transport protein